MNKTLKGSFFVVKGLGVLLVGVPSLVVAASLFCWLVSIVIGPAIVFSAVAWSLWKLPGAIKYRRVKGEWSWTTKAKAKGWKPGDNFENARLLDVERRDSAAYRYAELTRLLGRD
jgi:hypothetical protein